MIYVYDAQEGRNVFLGGQVEKVMGHVTEDIRDMGSDLLSRLVHLGRFARRHGAHRGLPSYA